jgi:predicted small lipoprotein YifL
MLLLLGLLAGCGRKGDLYMPDEEEQQPRSTQPGAPEAAPSDETETLPDLEDD